MRGSIRSRLTPIICAKGRHDELRVRCCSNFPLEVSSFHTYCLANSSGWLTVIGWIAALTAVSYFVVDLSLRLVTLNNDVDYQHQNWHGTLLTWAALLLCVIINVFISGALPSIEVIVLIIHVLGFFGILVPLVYLTPFHNSAKDVFTTFNNGGGWNGKALAFFIGLQGNALCFVGTDSPVHVSQIDS